MLIPLLDNTNREVRLEVIPYLRDLPLASAREQVKERYALEQDSEVKSLYEKELLAVW